MLYLTASNWNCLAIIFSMSLLSILSRIIDLKALVKFRASLARNPIETTESIQ